MKIHVSELEGRALDYAVAVAGGGSLAKMGEGFKPHISMPGVGYVLLDNYSPSTDWGQCGLLVDGFEIDIQRYDYEQQPFTFKGISHNFSDHCGWLKYVQYGPTRMIAACRAIVAAKLGDEVEIPDELVK